jgi:xanthine dehydrogenase YagR molybdenum-binding subunit
VKFELGDSALPYAPVAGGSMSTASVGHALTLAADALKESLLKISMQSGSPLAGLKVEDVVFSEGKLVAKADSSKSETLASFVARSDRGSVEGLYVPAGPGGPPPAKTAGENYDANQAVYAFQSFGCHFVEATVGDPIPNVRVTRVVSVIDNGKVINLKTSNSQVMGGVIMGIGMALLEETAHDPKTGRPVTDNLADYAVCVNADIHAIEPHFIDKPDPHINALGCRGVGEIGITGVAAAVANAVYHATGKRVRDLPITMDKLL